ncbi:Resolvase domain protein [Desulfofarcimen acetoxidans DSM 771]|uniref:Resolvase domain protein n=1 Tax=Desulfofarcimen acetoxidans (strain ATCC 49208 / DSM 771 / KCTC 5769 / VKM B-1644 / 5575) TaxID=485916 RepID=C8W0X4_DESAS|nr:Resolvase domain protein [Desulfofarcimen acetoxidans DSM 771]
MSSPQQPSVPLSDDYLIAIYLRVSSDEQAKSQQGLQGQLYSCEDFIRNKFPNSKIIEVYSDEGISADKTEIHERYELARMLVNARKGLFNTIVVFKQDRIARNNLQCEFICNQLDLISVPIWEADNSKKLNQASPQDKFFRQLLASFAELEVENTRTRIKATKKGQKAAGQFSGGDLPYGFRWDKDNKKIIEVDDEIRIWLQIIYKYLVENKGSVVISNELNKAGIQFRTGHKTRNGSEFSKWDKNNVLSLLRNPILTGHLPNNVLNRYVDADGKRRVSKVKPRNIVLQKTPLLREIIPLDLWYRIIDKMESKTNQKIPPRSMSTSWLLSGLLKCSCCGATMIAKDTGKKSKSSGETYKYYKCPNNSCTSPCRSIRKNEVELAVINELFGRLDFISDNTDTVKKIALKKIKNDYDFVDNSIDAIKAEIIDWNARLNKAQKEYDEGRWEPELYQEEVKRYKKIIEERKQILQNKQLELEIKMHEFQNIEATLNTLKSLKDGLENTNKEFNQKKRAILLTLINYVIIENGNPHIYLRAETGIDIPEYLRCTLDDSMQVVFGEIIAGELEVSATSCQWVSSDLQRHGLSHQQIYYFELSGCHSSLE